MKPKSTLSNPHNVSKGVRQGSVLGPLLFILFITDLSLNLPSSECLSTDDVSVYSTSKSLPEIENKMQLAIDLHSVQQWCWDNCMTLSRDKTLAMLITLRATKLNSLKSLNLKLQDWLIPTVEDTRLFGVPIDNHLTSKKTNLSC